jgi:hypothetical protein
MSAIEKPNPAFDEAEADRRLSVDQRDIVATLAKADNRMRARDYRAANAYYGQVGRLAQEGGTIARTELLRARDATIWLADYFRQAIVDGLASRGITATTMHPRFAKSLAIMFGEQARDPVYQRFPQMPNSYFYPDLPYLCFSDPSAHGWTAPIEAGFPDILEEAEELLKNSEFAPHVRDATDRPQGDVHGLVNDPRWSTWDLTAMGVPVPERTGLCPRTFELIDRNAPLCRIPSRAPTIMFSLLRGGARIPPHTGMMNARIICHLPLIVPGSGALRVGDQVREWQPGRLLMFDDTVEHEAWNHSSDNRLVLIFDVWRDEIEQVEREQICALFETVDESQPDS